MLRTVYGSSKNRTTIDDDTWIEPGSRPILITDNDETVSCYENEFQSRCDSDTMNKVSYSCTSFFNGTDSYLLWYQELQKQAIFIPDSWTYQRADNNGQCRSMRLVNFYITETNRDSIKMIDTSNGDLLQNFENYGNVNVCYNSPEFILWHVRYYLDRFVQCLTLYGDGIHL